MTDDLSHTLWIFLGQHEIGKTGLPFHVRRPLNYRKSNGNHYNTFYLLLQALSDLNQLGSPVLQIDTLWRKSGNGSQA